MNLHIHLDPASNAVLLVSFNRRLQHVGSDFTVYANVGYQYEPSHSDLLKVLMEGLLNDTSGVGCIKVTVFGLSIFHSPAVSADTLTTLIFAAARSIGEEPVQVP